MTSPKKFTDEWTNRRREFALPEPLTLAVRRKVSRQQSKNFAKSEATPSPATLQKSPTIVYDSQVVPNTQLQSQLPVIRTATEVEWEQSQREIIAASQLQVSQYDSDSQSPPHNIEVDPESEEDLLLLSPHLTTRGFMTITADESPMLKLSSLIKKESRGEISSPRVERSVSFGQSSPPKKFVRIHSEANFKRPTSSASSSFSGSKSLYDDSTGTFHGRLYKGGLAEKFLTALKAERSESNMRRHSMSVWSQTEPEWLDVKVESLETECHLNKTICSTIAPAERLVIYFTKEEAKAKIDVGQTVRLFHPFMRLQSPTHTDDLIICPLFFELL